MTALWQSARVNQKIVGRILKKLRQRFDNSKIVFIFAAKFNNKKVKYRLMT
jgi:hypothetical protein